MSTINIWALLCNFKATERLSTQPPSPKEFIWISPASLLTATQQKAYQSSIFVIQRLFVQGEREQSLQTLIIGILSFFAEFSVLFVLNWCITFKRAYSAWVHLPCIMVCITCIVPSSILQKLQTMLLFIMGFFFLCLTASTYFVNGITVTAHEWPTVALPRVYGTEGSRITLTGWISAAEPNVAHSFHGWTPVALTSLLFPFCFGALCWAK